MADLKKELQDLQRRNNANQKLIEIDGKISACSQVRSQLTSLKSQLDTAISDWEAVQSKLNSDSRYTQIVTPDVFEGEMANRLRERMDTVQSDIRTGISDSEALAEELQSQINALDEYSSTLSGQRAYWSAQLY